MTDAEQAQLGDVQRTLFFPLLARARETARKHPLLRDPKAVELVRAIDFDPATYDQSFMSFAVLIRTMILDWWVRQFLAAHPHGTVVELGTGLNTRFERTDTGSVHWIDLDLPDTIELRRRFFADSGHRRMVAASVLDQDWMPAVQESPGPYFFAADGVLAYLDQAPQVIARIAEAFPGALIAFDTYSQRTLEQQHKLAARKNMDARWAWSCDDPRTLESLGLEVVQEVAVTRPPAGVRARLPRRYRYALPLVRRIVGDLATVTLFRAR